MTLDKVEPAVTEDVAVRDPAMALGVPSVVTPEDQKRANMTLACAEATGGDPFDDGGRIADDEADDLDDDDDDDDDDDFVPDDAEDDDDDFADDDEDLDDGV